MGDDKVEVGGMVSAMVHGTFKITYTPNAGGGYDLRMETAIGEAIHPVVAFVGETPVDAGQKERDLALFAVLKGWYDAVAAGIEQKYGDDLKTKESAPTEGWPIGDKGVKA